MEKGRLSDELRKYGYVFSVKKSLTYGVLALAAMVLLGRFFGLRLIGQLILCAAGLSLLPFFLRNAYRHVYEQERFSEANIYMEQFLYSFRKTGKILETIEDTLPLFSEGNMASVLMKVKDYILHTYNDPDMETHALELVENDYPYEGIKRMHRFAIQTERLGGEFDGSVRLLLESRRMWADRVYAGMQRAAKQRRNIVMSIAVSLLLCSAIYYMAAGMAINVSDNIFAQVVTVIVLLSDILIYYLADSRITSEFLNNDRDDEETLLKQYERIESYGNDPVSRLGRRIAMRKVSDAIERAFPDWLMQVSLLLQTENVEVAIFKSYDDAPALLKPALAKLIENLKKNPGGVSAYVDFLEGYALPEVRSAMKMLYSLSSGSGEGMIRIDDIIRRNQMLYDNAKKTRQDDEMAGMHALFLAPQLTGGFKLAVDMVLLLVVYLTGANVAQ